MKFINAVGPVLSIGAFIAAFYQGVTWLIVFCGVLLVGTLFVTYLTIIRGSR